MYLVLSPKWYFLWVIDVMPENRQFLPIILWYPLWYLDFTLMAEYTFFNESIIFDHPIQNLPSKPILHRQFLTKIHNAYEVERNLDGLPACCAENCD